MSVATRSRTGKRPPRLATSLHYRLLTSFVILVLLLGGSSRAESLPLLVLYPVAALLCGYGFYTLQRKHYERYRFLFWLVGATIALCLIHLCPLPPVIWQSLPGRQIIVEVDQAVGLVDVWRPLTMVPYATRDALFSLLVPLATLLLASQLNRAERERLLPLLIGIGMLSAMLGILQVLGGDSSPFYFYSSENNGSAVGLFANRNHSAVFLACLFPMLAAFASQPSESAQRAHFRFWLAVIGGLTLVPILVISGSRAAILVALPALMSVPLLYQSPVTDTRRQRAKPLARRGVRAAIVATVIVAIALVILVAQRTEILSRFLLLGQGDDLRSRVWGGILRDAWRFLPFGSGIGSFVEVYQVGEPYELLRSSYLNHAHNDLFEVAVTAGLPGLLLVAVALIGWARETYDAWKGGRETGNVTARMASVILFMLFLASFTDYPLRTPSLACFGALAALWLAAGTGPRSGGNANE